MKVAKTKAAQAARPEAQQARPDVYQAVTDRILEALEGGVIPWRKGWNTSFGLPRNYATGHVYQGINAFLLSLSPVGEFPLFMTYQQAQEMGGQVRRGEKGQKIIFASYYEKKAAAEGAGQGEQPAGGYSFLREFTVFNISQIDGIEWQLPELGRREFQPCEAAETLAQRFLGRRDAPELAYGGGRAYYSPMLDLVQMPPRNTFRSEQAFYRTLFHELGHATGAGSRLNRPEVAGDIRFGSEPYGREELVAEMTTAFLSAEVGFAPEPEGDQHASYIQSWLRVLRGDKKLVVQAAAQAQKAACYIKGEELVRYERQPKPEAHPLALAA